jgi:hypothetical protein
MPYSVNGGWRGFSLLKQVDNVTAKTVNTLLYYEGEPIETQANNFWMNKGEITGDLLPTQARILNKKLAGKHKSKLHPHIVGLLASMAMGKDTVSAVGATTAYNHKLEIDKTVVELPKRTMIENDGFEQTRFIGVGCTGFKISAKENDFVDFEADLMGTGLEVLNDPTAKPARVNESYMAYNDAKFYRGGTFNGTTVTGETDFSASLIGFDLEFKNEGKGRYQFGDASGTMAAIRRGQSYTCDFGAEIELEDASHKAALLAGTEYVVRIPIEGEVANGAAKYKVEIILPRVRYAEANKKQNDGILAINGKFAVMSDPAYGGLIINVVNLQQANYLAAA